MTKGIAVFILPLVLLGCGEEQHDVEYYLKNEAIRKTTESACEALPDNGLEQPNCVNAALAGITNARAALEELAKARVRLDLKDPDSAQFSYVHHMRGTGYVCGFVNAKNSYGGYIGDRAFAVGDGSAFINDGRKGSAVNIYIEEFCGDR